MEQDFVSQRRRDQGKEFVEILLHFRRFMNILKITKHIILDPLRKPEWSHWLLDHIKLVLKRLLPLIDGSHQRRHVTEDETGHDRTQDHNDGCKEGLAETHRTTIIALNKEHLIIEDSVVLVPNGKIEEISVEEVNILGRYPILLLVPDQHLPNACQPMYQQQ